MTASQAERAAEREARKNRMVVGRQEALQVVYIKYGMTMVVHSQIW